MSTSSIIFNTLLLVTAFLCTVVFGEMIIFQTVIMPGIAKLDDGAFLHAFQLIDGVIQSNEPVFVCLWIGSVIAIVATAVCGVVLSPVVSTTDNVLTETWQVVGLIFATLAWLVCQKTTFSINVPRNNRVKMLDIANLKAEESAVERAYFEATWNFWHKFRTILFGLSSFYLLVLLLVAH